MEEIYYTYPSTELMTGIGRILPCLSQQTSVTRSCTWGFQLAIPQKVCRQDFQGIILIWSATA